MSVTIRNQFLFLFGLMIFAVCVSMPFSSAQANEKYASIIIDAETGEVISQQNADKKLHPASLTKIMTLMMVFDALNQGKIGLNDRMWVSKYAASMVPSKLDLKPGSSIKVKDAIYSLVTKSANDVAVVIAEHLAGSEYNFARNMTRRAHLIGMKNTNFTNASGLHDPKQVSSARDMATLARTMIVNYPNYYRYFSTEKFTYNGATYNNHNRLLGKYPGLDGIKTGYVNASGFNLVASAVQNDRRLIGVVFGGKTGASRNAHMEALLNTGFAKADHIRFASAPLPPRKPGMVLADSSLDTNAVVNSANDNLQAYQELNEELDEKIDLTEEELDRVGEGAYEPSPREQMRQRLAYADQKKAQSPEIVTHLNTRPWAIQVGAFSSRARSDAALYDAVKKLPDQYAQATPVIAPLKTDNGWLFRARLSGYNKSDAFTACRFIEGCMAVAPK